MSDQTDHLASTLKRSADLLRYRRLNWTVETSHRIRWEFEALVREARVSGVPLNFSLQEFDTPNEGVLQLVPASRNIGVVDRRHDPLADTGSTIDTKVLETGGELVASLDFLGHVHFIAHPRRSGRTTPTTNEIILEGPLDPGDVTQPLIRKVLRKYLLILRSTSVVGMADTITLIERAAILSIYAGDIRKRHHLIRSVLSMTNEWAKLLVAGLIAFLAGYITGNKP